MTRVVAMAAVSACSLALLASLAAAAPAAAKAKQEPNVVLVVTDDQAASTLRPEVMPHLFGRLAARGTTFTDAIVTTPLCCPSRASMLTGQYGHNNGVLRNDYRQLRRKNNTLPTWLRRAGYRTIHLGKYLNLYRRARGRESKPAPGWDVWRTVQEPSRYYGYRMSANGRLIRFGDRNRDYLTDVLNRKAVRLVRGQAKRRKPFFLQIDHWAPHNSPGRGTGPCHSGPDPVPAPVDEHSFADEPLPRPPSFNEADVSDKPSFIQAQPPLDADRVERNYRCALASLQSVDRGILMLHRVLKRTRQLRNTVIAFVSDNGIFYGEHRQRRKSLPYEEALKVPLVIALPKPLRGGATVPPRIGETVANIDLAPTILQLARAKPCRRKRDCRVMDGRSLMPLLRGETQGWSTDRAMVIQFDGRHRGFGSCAYRAVRTPIRTYVEHTRVPDFATRECVPSTEREHYERAADPFQLHNLYPGAPGSADAARQDALAQRLASIAGCSGIAGRDRQPSSGGYCE